MAKLTGKAKEEFLKRMQRGRNKAARKNPKRKATKKNTAKRKATKKKAAKKNPLRGAAKKAFLERMARGRRKAARGSARNGSTKKGSAKPRKRGHRRNPDTMEEMYETFHQAAPGHIVTYDQLVKFPDRFAELGELRELRVFLDESNPAFPFTRFGDCKAVCTPDGKNIYFVGGDQAIDLAALDIGGEKDLVEIGPCVYIQYLTTKGFHDFEPIRYEHDFGEENGVTPVLAYDRLNRSLFLIGGDYRVERPGIIN